MIENTENLSCDQMINQIVCGDSVEVLKIIPDKSIDLVLTDPPYGIDIEYNGYEDSQENLKKLVHKIMPEILRVSKRALITCGVNNIQLYPKPNWILSWINPAGAALNSWGFGCWQPILCYGKDVFLENGKGARQDIIIHNEQSLKESGHPVPKPLGFWEKLLLRGSLNEGDIILDPFAGIATTARAAKRLHRKYICIEQSKKYCEIGDNLNRQEILL